MPALSPLPASLPNLAVRFAPSAPARLKDAVLVAAVPGKTLPAALKPLDTASGRVISRYLAGTTAFKGKAGHTGLVTLPEKSGLLACLLVGTDGIAGKPGDWEETGGRIQAAVKGTRASDIVIDMTAAKATAEQLTALVAGFHLGAYRFSGVRQKDKDDADQPARRTLHVITRAADSCARLWAQGAGTVGGITVTRDLVSEPPNTLYPDAFAKKIKSLLTPLGVKVTVLDETQLAKEECRLILAVGGGASKARQPRLVIMEYAPGHKGKGTPAIPLALVGKGITFDTGGYSLKPPASMPEMIMDMGGAATVVGIMHAHAAGKAKTPLVGIVALAENMVSGDACRPSDVVVSKKGLSVEILNTDAEGRLVLADAMTYVQQRYKPKTMIDFATLTGAILVALGTEYAGLFGNSDALIKALEKSGAATSEKIWHMPLDDNFRKSMKGTTSDLKNISGWDRFGGSCTAAAFLDYFVEKGVAWAHLDIAGAVWENKGKPHTPKGASGYGVRLVLDYIRSRKAN